MNERVNDMIRDSAREGRDDDWVLAQFDVGEEAMKCDCARACFLIDQRFSEFGAGRRFGIDTHVQRKGVYLFVEPMSCRDVSPQPLVTLTSLSTDRKSVV